MRPTRVHRRRGPRRSTSQLASSLRSRTHVRSVAATAIARDGQHVRFALAGGNGPDDFQRLRIDHGHRVVQFWFQALDRRTGYRGSPARSASRSDSPIIAMRLQPMETSWPGTVASRQRRLTARRLGECCPILVLPAPRSNPAGLVEGSRWSFHGGGGNDHRFSGDDPFASRRDAKTSPSE